MYYIYHIPGVKIGTTNDPDRRMREQGYTVYEILETHNDIRVAGDRELYLQKQYGYPVDHHHYSYMNQLRLRWKSDSEKKRKASREGYRHTEETKAKIAQGRTGKRRGRLYVEVNSGFIGTVTDMCKHFNLSGGQVMKKSILNDRPLQSGPRKGLHFRIYKDIS